MPSRRTPILIAQYIASLGNPPPDLTFITNSLAVGGALRSDRQIGALPGLGITAVVDMRSESLDNVAELERLGIRFLHLPTKDWTPPTQEDLTTGTAWALDEMAHDGKVLLHCQHGVGRSVILGGAVLVKMGYDWQTALRLIREKRVGAAPHGDQVAALAEFAENQKKTR
jgi:protein-tyrosine phosphatase